MLPKLQDRDNTEEVEDCKNMNSKLMRYILLNHFLVRELGFDASILLSMSSHFAEV